jgi:hypothetical protein
MDERDNRGRDLERDVIDAAIEWVEARSSDNDDEERWDAANKALGDAVERLTGKPQWVVRLDA